MNDKLCFIPESFFKGVKIALGLRSLAVLLLLLTVSILLKHQLRLLLSVKLHLRTRINCCPPSNLIHRNCRDGHRLGIVFV